MSDEGAGKGSAKKMEPMSPRQRVWFLIFMFVVGGGGSVAYWWWRFVDDGVVEPRDWQTLWFGLGFAGVVWLMLLGMTIAGARKQARERALPSTIGSGVRHG